MKPITVISSAIVLLTSGCSDLGTNIDVSAMMGRPLDASVNGKTIGCPVNQTFSLELDLNWDAGYMWDHTISDKSVLDLDSTSYRRKDGGPTMVGGLAVETFYFHGLRAGVSTVTLNQLRAWESAIKPISTIAFAVSVHP